MSEAIPEPRGDDAVADVRRAAERCFTDELPVTAVLTGPLIVVLDRLDIAEARVAQLEAFVLDVADYEIYFACKVERLEGKPDSAINVSDPRGAVVLWTRRAAALLGTPGAAPGLPTPEPTRAT